MSESKIDITLLNKLFSREGISDTTKRLMTAVIAKGFAPSGTCGHDYHYFYFVSNHSLGILQQDKKNRPSKYFLRFIWFIRDHELLSLLAMIRFIRLLKFFGLIKTRPFLGAIWYDGCTFGSGPGHWTFVIHGRDVIAGPVVRKLTDELAAEMGVKINLLLVEQEPDVEGF